MMSDKDESLLKIVKNLLSSLEAASGDADDLACAAGEALISAGAAIDGVGKSRASGALLRRLGTAGQDFGAALHEVERVGCSGSPKSQGGMIGLAETLILDARALEEVAVSMKPENLADEQACAVLDLPQRIAGLASELALNGLDLIGFAGGVQPTEYPFAAPPAGGNCAGDFADLPDWVESMPVASEPDFEAADAVVRRSKELIVAQNLLLIEAVGLLVAVWASFRCSTACTTCSAVITGPAAPAVPGGGLTVLNNGSPTYVATQTVNWSICCCDSCWIIWTDFWSVPKATTLSWTTRIATTRPVGAAVRAARRGLAARIAAAPPPAPLCP